MAVEINEYIEAGAFNSKSLGLYLTDRDAPTPTEKVITESLDYMDGVLDFSNITGERFYDMRTHTFTFWAGNMDYPARKALEDKAKQQIMSGFETKLYDTHDAGVYWVGKCASVRVTDNSQARSLTIVAVFTLHPYAIKDNTDSRYPPDNWDTFDFFNDFLQPFTFQVNDSLKVKLMNIGETQIVPQIITSGNITITNSDAQKFIFTPNKETDYLFSLARGMNELTITGSATVRFVLKTEVML